jgi:hypothetical protein
MPAVIQSLAGSVQASVCGRAYKVDGILLDPLVRIVRTSTLLGPMTAFRASSAHPLKVDANCQLRKAGCTRSLEWRLEAWTETEQLGYTRSEAEGS